MAFIFSQKLTRKVLADQPNSGPWKDLIIKIMQFSKTWGVNLVINKFNQPIRKVNNRIKPAGIF